MSYYNGGKEPPYCTCPPAAVQQHSHFEPYDPSDRFVVRTVLPGHSGRYCRRHANPESLDCEQLGQNCLGALTYGTANCLAAAVDCTCGLVGGCVRALCGGGASSSRHPRQRLAEGQPYSWKAYEVGDYEYDMVVYRRPRRNFFQKLFDC